MKFEDFPLEKYGQGLGLVGAIFADREQGYFCQFPEYQDLGVEGEDVEMTQEDWQKLLRQSDLMETEVLAKHKDGKLYKAIIRKSSRQISAQVSWNVFRRDGYECRYCGNNKIPLTVDHLILWEEGGPSIEENLVAACKKCNKTRGNKQYAAWLNDPYYLRVSKNLTDSVREENQDLVHELSKIARRYHKISSR